jgi:Tetratricopeptide repeat
MAPADLPLPLPGTSSRSPFLGEKIGNIRVVPDVAMTINNLALVRTQQKRYAEADALFRRALAIRDHWPASFRHSAGL